MAGCVLSNQNRFYAGLESTFGQIPTVSAAARFAGTRLGIRQRVETPRRRDKTGGRTYTGAAPGARRYTSFDVSAYPVVRATPSTAPSMGPLVQAAMGAAPVVFSGGVAGSGSSVNTVVFSSAHGLVKGQAFGFNGELRFVETVSSTTSVLVNAPLSSAPAAGQTLTGAVTYFLADSLPSASVFDYWDPSTVVSRVLNGASVDRFRLKVNADYHQLELSGEAQDVLDSVTFVSGEGGLSSFPTEPSGTVTTLTPIPGNLGQAWLGTPSASRFYSVTAATVELDNDIDMRTREFGSLTPQCATAGLRRVTADIDLYETDDEAARSLYAAARNEAAIQVMFQLGEAAGAMIGVYLPQVVPQLPEFDDGRRILQWRFRDSRAQGSTNDEMVVAFG
ncbi:MAG: hypothetical protein H6509_10825 [Bryobacterales bacterium]|nr:hypothetical protein [Bryobacterales bacterium]